MKSFKKYAAEAYTRKDLHPKYQGRSTEELVKRRDDMRKTSPSEREDLHKEISLRSKVRESSEPQETSAIINEMRKAKEISKSEYSKHKQRHIDQAAKRQFGHANSIHIDYDKKTGVHTTQTYAHKNHKLPTIQQNFYKASGKYSYHIYEETGTGAPANNTSSGPGMGDDSSLHMKKMRSWKKIHNRHKIPEGTEDSSTKYYMQPDGSWKKGGDGRSPGKTLAELESEGRTNKIRK